MKPLSMDIRLRIVSAYDAGDATRQDVANRFGVSLGMVKKLLCQRRRLGHVGTLYENVGRKPAIDERRRRSIKAAVSRNPGMTLAEIRRRFRLGCSIVTVHTTLVRMGLTYKKRLSARQSRGARTLQQRGGTGFRAAANGTPEGSFS